VSRLTETFKQLKSQNKKALVVYLTAGDKSRDETLIAARAAIKAGADVIELGVPFSDPMADGPVIQRAMQRALKAGGGFLETLAIAKELRKETQTPLVIFGYANPLLYYGLLSVFLKISDAGADGILIVDVPIEEAEPWKKPAAAAGLDWITLVTPTAPKHRIEQVVKMSSGFCYVVSMLGVTGGQVVDLDPVKRMLQESRNYSNVPLCVGFGVRDRQGAKNIAAIADGVVVGSALISAMEQAKSTLELQKNIESLVGELRAGVDEA